MTMLQASMLVAFVVLNAVLQCGGLQEGLQYKYHYEGVIATGIPEISGQVSSAGIEATLHLQVIAAHNELYVQLTDVRVTTFHGDRKCYSRSSYLPSESTVQPEEAAALEQPFIAHISTTRNGALEVPVSDLLWVTNVRKAIVGVFRVLPIFGNSGHYDMFLNASSPPAIFANKEHSIHGYCESSYFLYQLPEFFASLEDNDLTEDVQQPLKCDGSKTKSKSSKTSKSKRRCKPTKKGQNTSKKSSGGGKKGAPPLPPSTSGTSGPAIEKYLWRMERTINFDNCDDRVNMQEHVSIDIDEEFGGGQTKYVSGRSSVGRYLLRGSPGAYRVEEAIIEGVTTVSPYGYQTEKIHFTSNMSLTLEEVTVLEHHFLIANTKNVMTWEQEVISPYEEPNRSTVVNQRSWVQYLNQAPQDVIISPEFLTLGTPSTPEFRNQVMHEMEHLLRQAAGELYSDADLEGTHGLEALSQAGYLVYSLTLTELKQVFDHINFDDEPQTDTLLDLYIDTLAAAGTSHSITLLLHLMKDKDISDHRIMTIFMTLTANLVDPSVIPELMDYVMSRQLDDNNKITSSTILINFSTLLNKLCLDAKADKIRLAGPILGKNICNPELSLGTYMSNLKERLSHSTETWQRAIVVQAMVNLGTVYTMNTLQLAAMGQYDNNCPVRANALIGFMPTNLPNYARFQAMEFLQGVFKDVGEKTEIRLMALKVLIEWLPDASWWHQLARGSWYEPSRSVRSFIYTSIQSVAQGTVKCKDFERHIAAHVLKLAWPVPVVHVGDAYSFNLLQYEHFPEERIDVKYSFDWITNLEAVLPERLYFFLGTNYGGIKLANLEASYWSSGTTGHQAGNEGEATPINVKDMATRIALKFYKEITDQLHEGGSSSSGPELKEHSTYAQQLYLRIYENIQLVWVEKEDATEDLVLLALQMAMGNKLRIDKLAFPFMATVFTSTDLGIPFIVEMGKSSLIHHKSHLSLKKSNDELGSSGHDTTTISISQDTRYQASLTTAVSALVPWSNIKIMTLVSHGVKFTVPTTGLIEYKVNAETNAYKLMMEMQLDQHPTYDSTKSDDVQQYKVPLVKITNYPKNLILPLPGNKEEHVMRVDDIIQHSRDAINHHQDLLPKWTGLDGEIHWNSDGIKYPLSLRKLVDVIANPGIAYMFSSTAKHWRGELSVNLRSQHTNGFRLWWQGVTTIIKNELPPGQFDQNNDGDQYDQYDQGSHDYGFVPDEAEATGTYNIQDSPQQRSEKLKVHGGSGNFVSFGWSFIGSEEERKYEVSRTVKSVIKQAKIMSTSIEWAFMRSAIPSYHVDYSSICIDYQKMVPAFTMTDDIQYFIANLQQAQADVLVTNNCVGDPILHIHGNLRMTNEGHKHLIDQLKNVCDYDSYDPTFNYHKLAKYDEVELVFSSDQLFNEKSCGSATSHFLSMVQSLSFPYLVSQDFDVHNKRGQVHIKGNMNLDTEEWRAHIEYPEETKVYDGIVISSSFEPNPLSVDAISMSNSDVTYHNRLGHTSLTHHRCVMSSSSVRMFDGHVVDFSPSSCYVVAAHDCSTQYGWMVLVKSKTNGYNIDPESAPEVKLVMPSVGLVVEMTNGEVKVNGKNIDPIGGEEIVKDRAGDKTLCTVIKDDHGRFMVHVNGEVKIHLTDRLEMLVHPKHKSVMCGMCGDFDGEVGHTDMSGPNNCLYTDPNIWAASWSVESDDCDAYTLLEKKETVADTKCIPLPPRNDHAPRQSGLQTMNSEVITNVHWVIFESQNKNCEPRYDYPTNAGYHHSVHQDNAEQHCRPHSGIEEGHHGILAPTDHFVYHVGMRPG